MALSQTSSINANQDLVISGNGTAGTADPGVVTIQGIASATPVPISGTVITTNPSVGTVGSAAPTSATLSGGIAATTGATLTAGNLGDLSLTLASALRTDSSATTQPISAASLPLPTGAATSANQTSEITQLTAIATSVAGPTPAGTNSIGSVVVPQLASATATLTSVALAITTSSVLASNAARKGFIIFNDAVLTIAYIAFAATATTSAYTVKIAAGGSYESPTLVYTGAMSVIASAASGNLRVTELT